jgi:hypothetical protein
MCAYAYVHLDELYAQRDGEEARHEEEAPLNRLLRLGRPLPDLQRPAQQ